MKTVSIIFIGLVLVFAGCEPKDSKEPSGTYTNQSESEYSTAFDTLTIKPLEANKTYQIEESIGFQRKIKGVLQVKQYKTKNWQATWDVDKSVLSETQYGRQLYYDEQKQTLTIKNTAFTRIK